MGNEWNNTALVAEFETMLRRRLRSGAAPVAACAGFDLDAASAYLEGALGGSHRAGYESHLAGCATCRRHLIELARLAQCAPLAEAQPAAAPNRLDKLAAWWRWKDAIAVWFNLSSWNFKWPIAGATGAAFAILIAALGVQSWRQTSKQPDVASAERSAPSNLADQAESPAQPLLSPTAETAPQNAGVAAVGENTLASIAQNSIPVNPGRLQVPAPKPLVGPQPSAANAPLEASTEKLGASLNLPVDAPAAPVRPNPIPSAAPQIAQNPALRLDAFADTKSLTVANRSGLSASKDSSNEQVAVRVTKDPVYELRPSPPRGLNPMKSESPDQIVRRGGKGFLSGRQASPNPETNFKQSDTLSRIKDAWDRIARRNPIKWPFNSDSEQKPVQEDQDSPDNAIVWRFRGKVFVFDKGTWIDQEYKPEMQEWRRWTLTRGSEQYNQALTGEPQLKEFFDHGPILIVWKNQIYKVLK